ncbi:hypothetical protein DBT_0232 [Dissulfuribacter thermophilus]|uniref:Uncharacterized protein n=1 Tax=Dissulfuribacter thermophilus TaxID=1156395 RepID=A0A1B9F988_9BACT|nr:hypothetical protein DBT_0232 [Dissulfuribacter thermophilus]
MMMEKFLPKAHRSRFSEGFYPCGIDDSHCNYWNFGGYRTAAV